MDTYETFVREQLTDIKSHLVRIEARQDELLQHYHTLEVAHERRLVTLEHALQTRSVFGLIGLLIAVVLSYLFPDIHKMLNK